MTANTTPTHPPQDEYLQEEYRSQRELFEAQAPIVQRFLESQARQLAEALFQGASQARFTLPDRVTAEGALLALRPESREQMAGGLIDRITGADLRIALRQRLTDLEGGADRALAVAGGLTRYATALQMVHGMLPTGRLVTYQAAQGEEIPAVPVRDELEPESAITASTDAIAEEGTAESGRGLLTVPFVSAARRFYLPQWVAFDDAGQLLVNSVGQAQAHLASMQRYVGILHAAVALAPYVVVDEEYQRKRYGMLGQLVNQGRALARYQTREIIVTIKRRAAASDLNRGLSLSLPYFDDQRLEVRHFDFEIIPAGRIMFVPAFVVRASREEQGKVAQDTRLSPSTRKYLLAELKALEEAFAPPATGPG